MKKKLFNRRNLYLLLADLVLIVLTIVPIYFLDTFSYIIYICFIYFFIVVIYLNFKRFDFKRDKTTR